MTKKDYIQIAAVLNANQADLSLVLDMADMLGEDNERFDRERFVRASTELLSSQTSWLASHIIKQRGES